MEFSYKILMSATAFA